jgi:sulfatase maturation enzyme AslB (radical SAM superfamily)
MITQICNLSCLGCTNYSDLKHNGYISWDQGKEWLQSWNDRIHLDGFGIMGGEPLINPQVREWLKGTRELLPEAQIRFTTNGLLLDKHWDLVDLAYEIGNITFKITVHTPGIEIESLIERIMKRYDWKSVTEYGIKRWITNNNFRFQINRPTKFIKTYQGSYDNMAPWMSNPKEAFDICVQQTCPLLHEGKIYKCSTAGLLAPILERFGRPNYDQWRPFIPAGLESNCSDQELKSFIQNFGKPHSICAQCPDKTMIDSNIIHYDWVSKK